MPVQQKLNFNADNGLRSILGLPPFYETELGIAVLGDSYDVLRKLPDSSVSLVLTSPPYALHFKKEYGNKDKHEYVDWMLPFAREIRRVLKHDGSFVLNIGGSYNKGTPTRSIYHLKLLVALVEDVGFHLAQECFWYNPAKMPMPAEFPAALPDFFIRLLTDRDDIVLDPFAGSNTLGMVAERLGRRWLAVELEEDYLRASKFRFEDLE